MHHAALIHDLTALAQVVLIDIALAGDNAVVVGLAVAGLPHRQKRPAIIFGIVGATAIRVALGTIAAHVAGGHRPAAGRRTAAAVGLLADVP